MTGVVISSTLTCNETPIVPLVISSLIVFTTPLPMATVFATIAMSRTTLAGYTFT